MKVAKWIILGVVIVALIFAGVYQNSRIERLEDKVRLMAEHETVTKADVDEKVSTHNGNVTDSHGRIAGILPVGQIPGLAASKIISGILAVARIPDLAANKITSGVLALARIPTGIQGKLTGACPYQYSHPGSPVCSGCPHPSGRYSHPGSPVCSGCPHPSGRYTHPTTGTCPQTPKAHGAAQHTNVTRELFLPANEGYIYAGAPTMVYAYAAAEGDANANQPVVYFTFKCPDDFVSFTSLKIVWTSTVASGNMYFSMTNDYAASGESLAIHAEMPDSGVLATGGASVMNVQEPPDPFVFPFLAKGDYIGIRFSRLGTNELDTLEEKVRFLGLLFTYTAEQ